VPKTGYSNEKKTVVEAMVNAEPLAGEDGEDHAASQLGVILLKKDKF
jgi:hypothetical protein